MSRGETVYCMGMAEFGLKLKRAREELGLSQEEVAERAKMAVRTLSRLESGEGNPTLSTLVALASTLKTSIDALTNQPQPAKMDRAAQERLMKNWFEASEVLNAIGRAKPLRRLVGLYILTRSETYLDEMRAMLPPQSPVLQALRLMP